MTTATAPAVPISRQRALLGDLSAALAQQMFFWGRDVLTDDNLLLRYGFKKTPSSGLKGTSCYSKRRDHGLLELHGSCAGWYPQRPEQQHGFLYVRTLGKCSAHHLPEPTVPGQHEAYPIKFETRASMEAAQRFAAWMVDYESWVQRRKGVDYRSACRNMLARLPKGKPWLPPQQALLWLQSFAQNGPQAPRARELTSR